MSAETGVEAIHALQQKLALRRRAASGSFDDDRVPANVRLGDGMGGGGGGMGGFALLNRVDLLMLLIMFGAFCAIAKAQYNVDVLSIIWTYVKPHYDDDLYGDQTSGALDGEL